jgi:hypothetical protein
MASKTDQKKADDRREAELRDGRFAAQESDDNSLATSDDGYVGVSPEYRNAAWDTDKPLLSEDEDARAIEEAAKEREKAREEESARVGFRGYEPNTPHPAEATQPAAARIEQNRTVEAAAAADAQAKLDGTSGDGAADAGSSPFGDSNS